MRTSSSLNSLATLTALAGLASSALAAEPPTLQLLDKDRLVPTRTAGLLYVNLQSGERTLTRYDLTEVPEISTTHATAVGGLFDYWMSIDENPCWDDSLADHMPGEGFALMLEDGSIDFTGEVMDPIAAFDFGDMPFDSKITGITLATTTLALEDSDSNADGILDTGIDTVAVYYDALSEGNTTSIAPPTAAVRIELIPGDPGNIPNAIPHYDIIVDFGGEHFELGDSDELDRGSMWLEGASGGLDESAIVSITSCTCNTSSMTSGGFCSGCTVYTTPHPTPDGLADFQYLQYYAQHGSNQKLTHESAFINFAAPEGEIDIFHTTYTTQSSGTNGIITHTYTYSHTTLTPDPLPQAQSANESFGLAALGLGGDIANLNWDSTVRGCCYWFGGIGCYGFLEQLELEPPYNPTWYNFTPYAQVYHGFFSGAPPQPQCDSINFAEDTVLDNADISAFIQFFLAGDLTADLNHDTFLDNGDITSFINLFLACTG